MSESMHATEIVESMFRLRQYPVPLEGTRVFVAGFHGPNSHGGGWFTWESESTLPEDGGTVLAASDSPEKGRWIRYHEGSFSAFWFGAIGDGTGRAPRDDRRTVDNTPWNQDKVSQDHDSWDSIGLQAAMLAVMRNGGELYLPPGTYRLTSPILVHATGQFTIRGAGPALTVVMPEVSHFQGERVLFSFVDTAGSPTIMRDLRLTGGGDEPTFTLCRLTNSAGVGFENCWMTHAQTAIEFRDHCQDWAVKNCTAEECELILNIGEDCQGIVEANDFWQGRGGQASVGIRNMGSFVCNDNQFMGFVGLAIDSIGEAYVSGNYFDSPRGIGAVKTGKGTLADNAFATFR